MEQVLELYQNQRHRNFKGWSGSYLLRSDPGRFTDHAGAGERDRLDTLPPPGWEWADGDTGWEVDMKHAPCDEEGWTYAPSFRDFSSSNPGLPAPAEHGTRVRRRRHIRRGRGVLVDEDEADASQQSAESGRPGVLVRRGTGESLGSRGSRRLTGRASVGFALAPPEDLMIEVMIHSESFVVAAGPNDSVRWLQEEASALFSKEHNFSTHIVQVVDTYPTDFLQAEAAGFGDAGQDNVLPLDPESLVKRAVSVKDREIHHLPPTEDGNEGVPQARVWARLQVTVAVPPGPLGVILDGEIGDRPVLLEIIGQSGPSSLALADRGFSETLSTSSTATATATPSPRVKEKITRKDRAKRLLLGLAMKHQHGQNAVNSSGTPAALGASAVKNVEAVSPTRAAAQVSPLVTASDAATVKPGMVLTSVAAHGGQGVSEEPVDTLGMSVKEAIETLVRFQHLHRNVTFVDPPPRASSDKSLGMGAAAGSADGVTCPFCVAVTVVEAKGLGRSDLFTADPFAWIRLGGSSQKTAVRKSTSHPQWGELFKFEILSLERSMVVQVWDADELGADVLLGEASMSLRDLPVNNPFQTNNPVVDIWLSLKAVAMQSGGSQQRGIRLKININQQLYVAIQKKKVDSAARLLQRAVRSFVFRSQSVGRNGARAHAPPLPPRGSSPRAAAYKDDAAAAFAAADAADELPRRQQQQLAPYRQSSRKSVAGAVGGGWEASGAHAASTLADVFPREEEVEEAAAEKATAYGSASACGGSFGSGNKGSTRGVSAITLRFLEGPALERFGGGGGEGGGGAGGVRGGCLRKSSAGTSMGRRSTVSFAASGSRSGSAGSGRSGGGRRSSASVRFVDGARRSSVGGWGEGDEAAKPGTSVCKDCVSDVASLLAVAMAPADVARTTMEDSTHLRYPVVRSELPPPLAVAAFPAPRGGFGPLTVGTCVEFDSLRGADWPEQAAPVLVTPSMEGVAQVENAAGEVWEAIVRSAAAGAVVGRGVTSLVGGLVGLDKVSGGGGGGGGGRGGGGLSGLLASRASVTMVLKDGGYLRIVPGEEFHYWRWASALSLAVAGSAGASWDVGNDGAFSSVVREVKAVSTGAIGAPAPDRNADAVCSLQPQSGLMTWARSLKSPAQVIPLSSVKGLILSQSHSEACKFLFTVTVVSGCLDGIAEGSSASWSGGKLQSYCRVEAGGEKSRTKVATGASPFWNHRCTFAVSEAEAFSPGGGARICCLSHKVAYQDSQLGETFIPFSALTSGQDYTETLDISGNLRRLRLIVHWAKGLVSTDVSGVSDPYCVVVPVRHDGSEVTSERGETSWRRKPGLPLTEWQEAFELCRWCAPENVKGIKVYVMDRDVGGRKDEALGEAFVPVSNFKEAKGKRTKVNVKLTPAPVSSSRYSRTLEKYGIKGGRLGGRVLSPTSAGHGYKAGRDSPTATHADLGEVCVSMSVVEAELPDTSSYKGGVPPGGIKVRCSLDLADEFTCAWPALLLRHGAAQAGAAVTQEDAGQVERWRVAAGFGGLVLSKVASGEGAAADSSPFLRMDPTGPADGYVMEVYENQRKKQPWGWGSGRKRHLRSSDPGRFSDAKGENRLHIKLLSQAEVPAGWAWSASEWIVADGGGLQDKDGWTYGKDASFEPLLLDRASGLSKEQRGSAVRCRRWVRPLHRTTVVPSAPALPPRGVGESPNPAAAVDIPDGLAPFCRAEADRKATAIVHENQRFQPGAGWGSSDEDHLMPDDRAPLTGAGGVHAIDDLDDIEPSALGPPPYRWEDEHPHHIDEDVDDGGWKAGPWTYADAFESLPAELPRCVDDPGDTAGTSPPGKSVRSRVWWRVMVPSEEGDAASSGRPSRGGGKKRESVAVGRRKVPHAVASSSSSRGARGAGGAGAGDGGGDRMRVPLDKLKRAVVIGPNTLLVELDVPGGDSRGGFVAATLVVGPCDAARLGSLLIERVAAGSPRKVLGDVASRARKLTSAPPPLPPRPSGKDLGSSGGLGRAGGGNEPGGWQSDPGLGNDLAGKAVVVGGDSSLSKPGNPFASASTEDASLSPVKPVKPFGSAFNATASPPPRSESGPSFGSSGDGRPAPPPPPPRPRLPPPAPTSPFQSRDSQQNALSPRRSEPAALEALSLAAVGLLQQIGRAVAALDDAYNAAYNAAGEGWGGAAHDMAELGEAVLWTLWSRMVRLQSYLRQLIAETPAQRLSSSACARRRDWGGLVSGIDAEALQIRGALGPDMAKLTRESDEQAMFDSAATGRGLEGSKGAVDALCTALDRRVTELLLCADVLPESVLRRAVEVVASQCYTKVVDEVGRHVTFRYEGLLPLADQELLALLDILVNKADLIERTLQPRLDLVGWRATPPPLLTNAVSVPWLLRAYATSIESKLSGLFRNILETNKVVMDFPPEANASEPTGEDSANSPKPARVRLKLGGGGANKGGRDRGKKSTGFTAWALHEATDKPLSVVPTTAMALLDTYVVTVAKKFPDDAGVQAVILRAGAGALGSLRNVISAHAEAAVSACPERGWDKLLRFLCATANDCWQLVADAVPAVEERNQRAMLEGAEDSYETLKQLWMMLGVSCCRKASRLVLGFMEADDLFSLEGMHIPGAEQLMVDVREALEYYCLNFLRPWLEEFFYHKVLVRLCDHVVVWAAQGLVRAAVGGQPALDHGQLLRLKACRDTLAEALRTCSGRKGEDGDGDEDSPVGAGGGMYERRLGFFDDLLQLITVPAVELEGVFTKMLQQHMHCQRSAQHALQVVLCLRADGRDVPEAVAKWADEANWMGGDAIVLTGDTAEIEPFHRVFRRPLSALRADRDPLVAPTVLARASDGRRQSGAPPPAAKPGSAKEAAGGSDEKATAGWGKGGLGFAGSGGLGLALGAKDANDSKGKAAGTGGGEGGGGGGGGFGVKKGMRAGMVKIKKGLRKAYTGGGGPGSPRATHAAESAAVVGGGVEEDAVQTILRVTILEAEGLRNVAVMKKTDSYVMAQLVTNQGTREARTSVKTNTLHPKWFEPLSFQISASSLVDAQLCLSVVGRLKLRDNLRLGHVDIPLAGIATASEGAAERNGSWFELRDGQGRLKVTVELVTRRRSLFV